MSQNLAQVSWGQRGPDARVPRAGVKNNHKLGGLKPRNHPPPVLDAEGLKSGSLWACSQRLWDERVLGSLLACGFMGKPGLSSARRCPCNLPLSSRGPLSCVSTRLSSEDTSHGIRAYPWWLSGQASAYQCSCHGRFRFDPWVGKIPWRRAWQPTPVFLSRLPRAEEPDGLQSLGLQRIRRD